MALQTIREADLAGKRVLTRVDFNVPIRDGKVTDTTRISAAMPTIAAMIEAGAYVILCSHLGRPKGEVREELRLTPVAPALRDLLNAELAMAGITPRLFRSLKDCVGPQVTAATHDMADNEVLLLENLRFHPGETTNDPEFAKQLAELADIYVSDAFGTVHRAHASTEGVAHLLPSYAGLLVEKEVAALRSVTDNPARPMTIVLGGVKISGKIEILENLLPLADSVLIGGAMANTFLKAKGQPTGKSLVEDEMLETAQRMLALAKDKNTELMLPLDYVVTDNVQHSTGHSTVAATSIGVNDIAVDIGEKTRTAFRDVISRSRTVFWNGPMGIFEIDAFAQGTFAVAQALASVYNTANTVVGGGESVSAVNKSGVADKIHHISTGGGASLEFVGGKKLPGIVVLEG